MVVLLHAIISVYGLSMSFLTRFVVEAGGVCAAGLGWTGMSAMKVEA